MQARRQSCCERERDSTLHLECSGVDVRSMVVYSELTSMTWLVS